jgi:multidrug efflux pump subunit AcrA (membrane-fusion protein)
VDAHRIMNVPVALLSRTVEAGSRQIRVGVEVPNPTGRLMPGRPVTIVIE